MSILIDREDLDELRQISEMSVGLEAALRLGRLVRRKFKITKTIEYIRICISPLGEYIINMPDEDNEVFNREMEKGEGDL